MEDLLVGPALALPEHISGSQFEKCKACVKLFRSAMLTGDGKELVTDCSEFLFPSGTVNADHGPLAITHCLSGCHAALSILGDHTATALRLAKFLEEIHKRTEPYDDGIECPRMDARAKQLKKLGMKKISFNDLVER